MNRISKTTIAIALAALTTASYAGIRADVTRTTRLSTWTAYTSDGALVWLNNNNDTLITFNLPAAGKKVLSYSAVCVAGTTSGAIGDIDIYVNAVVLAPTDGTDPFCHGGNQRSRHSIILVIQGKLGLNTVQIVGKVLNGGTYFKISDSSLVMHD